jgi:hypothetical protein
MLRKLSEWGWSKSTCIFYVLRPFCYLGRINSGCPSFAAVHVAIVRPSSPNSHCVYKPSWNNFADYPTSALNMSLMTVCERRRERERQEERNCRVDAHLQMTSFSNSFNDFPHSILIPSLSRSAFLINCEQFSYWSNLFIPPCPSPSWQKFSDSAGVQFVGLWIPNRASQSVLNIHIYIYIYRMYAQLLMKTTTYEYLPPRVYRSCFRQIQPADPSVRYCPARSLCTSAFLCFSNTATRCSCTVTACSIRSSTHS